MGNETSEARPGNVWEMTGEQRLHELKKLIQNEALIEATPSLAMLSPSASEGGSVYYGTGLTTPNEISVGVPFDILGMMLIAEKLRAKAGLKQVFHHIADTHAKTNTWIDPKEVDAVASRTLKTLEQIKQALGLDAFEFITASSFDTTDDYLNLVDSFAESDEHEYVRREMADMEWYRTRYGVNFKLGWIIQAKETSIGFDERRFDREYARFRGDGLSFIYTKPGRTFNPSRPKASPYIATASAPRLILEPGMQVNSVIETAVGETGDPTLGGAIKHLSSIVRLYESLYGSLGRLGPDFTLNDKLQAIADRCFFNS